MVWMKRHEAWRLEYRSNRYMRELCDAELMDRAGHFLTNLMAHSRDGRLAMKPVDLEGDASGIQRYTHVLEEMVIRGIDYHNDNTIKAMKPPLPRSPKVLEALRKLGHRNWPEAILVKFGRRQHMKELLLSGRGRISLASTYKDESLGYARTDDESCISGYVDPSDAHRFMVIGGDGHFSAGADISVPYLGSVPVTIRAQTAFYVYCMAEAADPRLFDDFQGADTCVVVKRPDDFKERIERHCAAKLPGWKFLAGPVLYFDPFFCRPHQMVPYFWKHFRFGYQKEYRLLWLPPTPEDATAPMAEHIYFDLGPLTDCAELLWL